MSKAKLRKQLIEDILKQRAKSANHRCRPRLSSFVITSVDSKTKQRVSRDVAYLQDYGDRLKAIQELIHLQHPTNLAAIYHKLDINGTGIISVSDLEAGLNFLRVPWRQVTGLTRAQLHGLLDKDRLGTVDILEFLGMESVAPQPNWSSLPLVEQWENYCNKVMESILVDDPVIGEGDLSNRREFDAAAIQRSIDKHPPSSTDFSAMSREDFDYIQSSVRKIEKFLMDCNENKRDMAKLKQDFQNVTEAEEKKAEQHRLREEQEEKRRRLKAEAGRALLSDSGGKRRSIFGGKAVELNGFKKPSVDELPGFFSLTNPTLISESEISFRKFLKNLKVPLSEGDRVRTAFSRVLVDKQFLEEEDFNMVMQILLRVPAHLAAATRFQGYWTSLKAHVSGTKIDLSKFLEWFASFTHPPSVS